jgi:hypothetical protein
MHIDDLRLDRYRNRRISSDDFPCYVMYVLGDV